MKTYIQPQICAQAIEAITIICVSVTNVKSNVVALKDAHVSTDDAR